MSEPERQIVSLLGEAVEYSSPEERAAFLDEACAGDVAKRARVEELLRAYQAAGNFLQGNRLSSEPAATVDDPTRERPGTIIGPYKLMEQIGEGGMGLVFVAEQQQPVRRKVALKVIKPGMDTRQVVARFEAERQALALMDHPNIAKVLDGGETAGGRPYFVMELVKGVPITQYCDQSQVPIRQRLELFVSVCQAVQHAHQKGIIHRDLKPSNVLVMSHDGTPVVKVIDFGVAKAIGQQLTDKTIYTQFSQLIGTPLYMSPEQAGESGLDVDTRSDIYSLGVLLYELLTGTTPFDKERMRTASYDEMRRIIREEEPPKPSTRISTLGQAATTASTQRKSDWKQLSRLFRGELDWIVMKALEKDRDRRYETANGFATDVQRYLQDEPVRACPPSAVYRLRKFIRRNKAAFLTTLAVAASLVLAVVALAISMVSIDAALGHARLAGQTAQEQLCDSLFVQAHAGRFSRQPGQRLDSLKALEQATQLSHELGRGSEELFKLRNEAIACLALPDVRLEKEWEGNVPGTNGLGFDARFERYAWSFQDEGIRICRLEDHQELLRLPTLPAERVSRWLFPRFSPDGRFLAVWYAVWASQRPLQVWELKPGVSQPLLALPDAATQPDFSPDGRTLAVGLSDNSLRLFDLTTGQETKRVALDLLPERLAFHPDGQKLAVSSTQQPRVQVCDLPSGQLVYKLPHPAGVQAVAWHSRGRLLATGCDDHLIYLWDGASGERRGVLEGHSWEVHDLAFNHTGEQLASFGWDMTLWLWDVAARKPIWHLENVRVSAFRCEEPLQAAGISGRQVRLWSCVPSTEFHVLRGPTRDVNGGTFLSPDGRYLSASTRIENNRHPETWIWDLRSKSVGARLVDVHCCGWDLGGNPLFATNQGQLVRRPVRDVDGDQLDLGPVESLLDQPLGPGLHYGIWCGRDRRLLQINSPPPNPLIQMIEMDGPARKLWQRVMPNHITSSSTADGRWWAAGTATGGRGISIFEGRSGKLVKELVIGDAYPAFSPDGRWLITTTGRLTSPEGECCLWRTDTWEKVRRHPLHRSTSEPAVVVVSPDSMVVAVAYTMSEVRLLHLETLEEIATLAAPEPGLIAQLEFSPDGHHMFVAKSNTVHAWDLRALRRGLRDIGLDWETPVPKVNGS
jgi:serine/threonine protein kinase/WD40 repeat protein